MNSNSVEMSLGMVADVKNNNLIAYVESLAILSQNLYLFM